MVENNLMLGNSANVMRSAFGVKSGEQITFRNNTVTGDLPSLAYAMRVNVENATVTNDEINFYNNIWSDPTGTMGSSFGGGNDFSDTPPTDIADWELHNNQYWNGGVVIPTDAAEAINYGADVNRITTNPGLPSLAGLVVPRWDSTTGEFADGSATIREAFVNLVMQHGVPASTSQGVDQSLPGLSPAVDILGNPRGASPDVGAFEIGGDSFGDFDSDGDVDGRDFLTWQRNPSVGNLEDWQANYGGGALSASIAVPEPSTFLLALLAGYPLSRKRQKI
jgi:hypothetical protein